MSLLWYDSEGKPFDGTNGRPNLVNDFTLEIRDKVLEETTVNECAQAARRLISGANDQYVSFDTDASVPDATISYGHFSIQKILDTAPTEASKYLDCITTYELYVQDTSTAEPHTYVKWEIVE
jgi:hypothetical protein